MPIDIGRVSYINADPLFCAEVPKEFSLSSMTPDMLNASALEGRLEIGIVSRWIYPEIKDNYRVVPPYCIAGDGEIMSVELFSKRPVEDLAGGRIFITNETGTSSRPSADARRTARPVPTPTSTSGCRPRRSSGYTGPWSTTGRWSQGCIPTTRRRWPPRPGRTSSGCR